MSQTPRTDVAYFTKYATMYDIAGEMKKLERELYAANQRIKRLEEELSDAYSEIRMHDSTVSKVFNYVVMQRAKEAKL
jgi:predicted  nucleic acid-binding Zn-ribbon protein